MTEDRSAAPSPSRCATVWLLATLAGGLLARALGRGLAAGWAAPPPQARVDAWLVLGCEAVALLVLGWLWVLVGLVVLETRRGATRRGGVPAAVRRVVLAACGAGLATGLAAPAYAASPTAPPTAPPPASPLAGLPLPDRPAGGTTRAAAPRPAPAGRVIETTRAVADEVVRVAPGDSLWAIAADGLPSDATAAQVDSRWRAIHSANRRVVGSDPDLIVPGQRLRLPPTDPPA